MPSIGRRRLLGIAGASLAGTVPLRPRFLRSERTDDEPAAAWPHPRRTAENAAVAADLPLFANLAGYSAVLALVSGISFTVFATIGLPGPSIISEVMVLFLVLALQFAFLHVVLWAGGTLWRTYEGYRS